LSANLQIEKAAANAQTAISSGMRIEIGISIEIGAHTRKSCREKGKGKWGNGEKRDRGLFGKHENMEIERFNILSPLIFEPPAGHPMCP